MVDFRPGVVPNDPLKPRLYFSAFRKAGAVPPASVDYYSQTPNIGMLGNDTCGDCVFAGNGHIVEQQTYLGQGAEYVVSTSQAIASYSRVTGYDPNAGPPGNNPTDQGTMLQTGLEDLQKVGFGGHVIAMFAQLDPRNINDVKLAVSEFGIVSIGIAFPNSAMTQFDNGQPWDVVQGATIEGGHCVVVAGYDDTYLYVYTWGKAQKMTYAFWNTYCAGNGGEAWAVISKDWVSLATGQDPEGVDTHALGAQFAALTGKPNPFPAPAPPPPAPTPPPKPTPPPAPTPPLDPAEQALVIAARRFLRRWFCKPRYLVTALENWLSDKDA